MWVVDFLLAKFFTYEEFLCCVIFFDEKNKRVFANAKIIIAFLYTFAFCHRSRIFAKLM